MAYDDDDKYIGSSGDARLHDADMEYDTDNICIYTSGDAILSDMDMEYDTDNICIGSSGDARCCVSTLSGCGGGMAERGVCMMCPNVITV